MVFTANQKEVMHHFTNEYLCTTERYAWKVKDIFAKNSDSFAEYFSQKKKFLLNGQMLEQDGALLHLLPEPWLLKDLKIACERILQAIKQKEKITIFGDYDVDGTTSCAMLQQFFAEINYPVDIYIPDRLLEGYGLNGIGLKKLAAQQTKLVITVDNGISAVAACNESKEFGIDVIVTDHHDIPPVLPNAFAILNPKQENCLFPEKMIAGVGVAFYLLIGLRQSLKENGFKCDINLKNYLDFVAIGTIADMAPLVGANYILCKIGLEVL